MTSLHLGKTNSPIKAAILQRNEQKGFLQNIAFCSWNVVSTWEQDDISENFFSRPLLMCSCKASCSMKWVLHSSKPHSPVHLNALWDGQRAGTTLHKWSINKLAAMKNPSINHQVWLKPIRASICTSITLYIYNYKVLGWSRTKSLAAWLLRRATEIQFLYFCDKETFQGSSK